MKQKNISTWDIDRVNLENDENGNPICYEKT
jgi:hypothetical protein